MQKSDLRPAYEGLLATSSHHPNSGWFSRIHAQQKTALVGGQDPVFFPRNLATPLHACHVGSPFSKNPRHLPNSILSHDFKPRSSHVFLSNLTVSFEYIQFQDKPSGVPPIHGYQPILAWDTRKNCLLLQLYIVIQVITHLNS